MGSVTLPGTVHFMVSSDPDFRIRISNPMT